MKEDRFTTPGKVGKHLRRRTHLARHRNIIRYLLILVAFIVATIFATIVTLGMSPILIAPMLGTILCLFMTIVEAEQDRREEEREQEKRYSEQEDNKEKEYTGFE